MEILLVIIPLAVLVLVVVASVVLVGRRRSIESDVVDLELPVEVSEDPLATAIEPP